MGRSINCPKAVWSPLFSLPSWVIWGCSERTGAGTQETWTLLCLFCLLKSLRLLPHPHSWYLFYAQTDLWIPPGGAQVGVAAGGSAECAYLQSMVRHSLLSLQEAPMGLRDTPLQKGVMRRCRALRVWAWGCLGDRDTPWL